MEELWTSNGGSIGDLYRNDAIYNCRNVFVRDQLYETSKPRWNETRNWNRGRIVICSHLRNFMWQSLVPQDFLHGNWFAGPLPPLASPYTNAMCSPHCLGGCNCVVRPVKHSTLSPSVFMCGCILMREYALPMPPLVYFSLFSYYIPYANTPPCQDGGKDEEERERERDQGPLATPRSHACMCVNACKFQERLKGPERSRNESRDRQKTLANARKRSISMAARWNEFLCEAPNLWLSRQQNIREYT